MTTYMYFNSAKPWYNIFKSGVRCNVSTYAQSAVASSSPSIKATLDDGIFIISIIVFCTALDLVQSYSPADRPSWSANRLSPKAFANWHLDASLVTDVA